MADKKDPFADIEAETDPFADITADESPAVEPRSQPLTFDERLKATLFFDDNQKRRASFMKRIGFELDPKDMNKVRPIGSQGDYSIEIDPGGLADIKQYYKTGSKAGLKELALDTVEAVDSFLQGAVEEAVGTGAGVLAGGGAGVATAPLGGAGAIPGFIGGRAVGRATANLLLNDAKEQIGNLFLDEEVPVEYQDKLFKAAVTSVAPEAVMGAGKSVVTGAKKALEGLRGGFKQLLNIGGGKVSEEALDAVTRDPKTFANIDNLKNATGVLTEKLSAITGLGPEDGVPKKFRDLGENSLFKQKMAASEELRKDTVNQLSGISEANTSVETAKNILKQFKDKLTANKALQSKDTQGVVSQIDDYMKQLDSSAGPDGYINFKQLDETIKEIQKDAYGSEGSVATGLREVSGQFNDYAKKLADTVAQKNGLDISSYSASKAKEAKIFDAYEAFAKNVTPQRVMTQVIGGGNKTATGTGADFTRKALTETFAKMDDALETKISDSVQSGQLQAELFRAIESSKIPRGSGGFLTGGATLAAPVALATGFNPTATTAAFLAGGIGSQPSNSLRAVSSLSRGINKLEGVEQGVQKLQTGALQSTPADMLRAAVQGSNIETPLLDRLKPSTAPTPPQKPDPFADF